MYRHVRGTCNPDNTEALVLTIPVFSEVSHGSSNYTT